MQPREQKWASETSGINSHKLYHFGHPLAEKHQRQTGQDEIHLACMLVRKERYESNLVLFSSCAVGIRFPCLPLSMVARRCLADYCLWWICAPDCAWNPAPFGFQKEVTRRFGSKSFPLVAKVVAMKLQSRFVWKSTEPCHAWAA
jgi:hypothetical protein